MANTRGLPRLVTVLAALALAGAPRALAAQVNAEALRPNPLAPGWSGGLDASLALAQGNVRVFEAGGAGRLQYQTLHPTPQEADGDARYVPFFAQRAFVTASGRFAERDGEAFTSQAFAHARWIGMWHPRVGSDLFGQFQYNEFLRLKARVVAGAGVRLELVHTPELLLWGASGYMFEYNLIAVAPGAPDAPEAFEHRWTNYLSARFALFGGRLLGQNTLYLQPRLDEFADLRLLDELELLAKVTDALGLGATLALLVDTAPPTEVRQADVRLSTVLRISL